MSDPSGEVGPEEDMYVSFELIIDIIATDQIHRGIGKSYLCTNGPNYVIAARPYLSSS